MSLNQPASRDEFRLAPAELKNVFDVSIQALTKQIDKLELPKVSVNNRNFLEPDSIRKIFEDRGFKYPNKVVAFQIVKGGAGKSSLSYSLAIRANQLGARVLCIDLDQQGNLTQALMPNDSDTENDEKYAMIDVIEKECTFEEAIIPVTNSLHLLPSNMNNSTLDHILSLKNLPLDRCIKQHVERIRKNYDLIIFDCPPALNRPNIAAALSCDEIIMPVNPDKFTFKGLQITTEEVGQLNKNFDTNVKLKIVYNKFHERKTSSTEFLAQLYSDELYKAMMYKTIIKESVELTNSINQNSSIFLSGKKSAIKDDLDSFAKEVLGMNELNKQTLQ